MHHDSDDEQIQRHEEDPEVSVSMYHVCKNLQSRTTPTPSITEEKQTKKQPKEQSTKRSLVDDPLFVASLDRTKPSSRQAMHIVSPALKAVGVDIESM